MTELFARNPAEREPSDERILGNGDFIKSVLWENDNYDYKWRDAIDDVLKEVVTRQGIGREQILGASRSRYVTSARSEFFLRWVHNLN